MSEDLKTYTITRTEEVLPGAETVTLDVSPRLTFKVGESHEAKTDRLTAAQLERDGYEVEPVKKKSKKKTSSKKAKKADKE